MRGAFVVLWLAWATKAQRRRRGGWQSPRDSKFVINAAKSARDAFAANEEITASHPDGDQQLLKMTKMGPLRLRGNWVDESGEYLRALATFRFAAGDAARVRAFAANATRLPKAFGVDVAATPRDASALCAFLTVAAPALDEAPGVARYVLTTVGRGSGSPFGFPQRFSQNCPGGLEAAARLLVAAPAKLKRWYASSHAPNALLGDERPGGAEGWDATSATAYEWPREASARGKARVGGAPVLRLVPVGLSLDLVDAKNGEDLELLADVARVTETARRTLLSIDGAYAAKAPHFDDKLDEARPRWPEGSLAAPTAPPEASADARAKRDLAAKFVAAPARTRLALDDPAVWDALFFGCVPVVEHTPVYADLLQSIPHVALVKWFDASPANLKRKYDGFANRGALQGVQRLAKAYWRDAYRRDLADGPPGGARPPSGDADAAVLARLHALLLEARCHVFEAEAGNGKLQDGAPSSCRSKDRGPTPKPVPSVPAEDVWEALPPSGKPNY